MDDPLSMVHGAAQKSRDACKEAAEASARQRLIRAAERCFVDSGFHGARMAQIAKEARMSPGHIYHYFSSKEQMIEEIIRSYADEKIEGIRALSAAGGDILPKLIQSLDEGVAKNADPFWSRLTLEITAEAARNPEIEKIVQEADRQMREEFVRAVSAEIDIKDSDPRHEVLIALLQGIGIRTIRNPDIDMTAVTKVVQDVMRFLFDPMEKPSAK